MFSERGSYSYRQPPILLSSKDRGNREEKKKERKASILAEIAGRNRLGEGKKKGGEKKGEEIVNPPRVRNTFFRRV